MQIRAAPDADFTPSQGRDATRTSFPSRVCYVGGVEPAPTTVRVKRRGKLFRKYVVLFVAVVTGALLANGIIEIYWGSSPAWLGRAAISRA